MEEGNILIDQDLFEAIKNEIHISGDIFNLCEATLIGSDFETFSLFFKEQQTRLKSSTCTSSWHTQTIVASCLDCQFFENSVLCLNCFLKSHHEGHAVYLRHTPIGACDCGNPSLFKSSGFCSLHQRKFNPDELTEQEKIKYITIFYSLVYESIHDIPLDSILIAKIFIWIQRLTTLSDSIRRCCTLAFIKLNALDRFIFRLIDSRKEVRQVYSNFNGSMINDPLFLELLSKSIIELYPTFIERVIQILSTQHSQTFYDDLHAITADFYLAFTPSIQTVIGKYKIDWIRIFYCSIDPLLDAIAEDCRYVKYVNSQAELHIQNLVSLARESLNFEYVSKNQEKINEFVKKLPPTLIRFESIINFKRIIDNKVDDPNKLAQVGHSVHLLFYPLIETIKDISYFSEFPFEVLLDRISQMSIKPKSVLSPKAISTPIYLIYNLAINSLLNKKSQLEEFILAKCNEHGFSVENIIDVPLKWIAVSILSLFKLFVRNSEPFILTTKATFYKINIPYVLVPTFSMIQIFFSIEPNKNDFLYDVANVFGLFKSAAIDEDVSTQCNIEFSALHFICCLIFDRYCIFNDLIGIKRMLIVTYLKKDGSLTLDQMNNILWGKSTHEKQFIDDLQSYSSLVQTRHGSHFKLTNDSDWQPLLPFVKLTDMFDIFSKFATTNPNSLMPFPDYEELPSGLDLKPALNSPLLYAIIYHILSNFVAKESTMAEPLQLIFNLLIKIQQTLKIAIIKPLKLKYIVTSAIKYLCKILPDQFSNFLYTKVAYKNREFLSMIEMIQKCGPLGITVLDRLGIHCEIPKEMNQTMKNENKAKAKALQQKFMNDFKKQQDSFATQNDEDEIGDECSVCHSINEENPVLVFPIFIYETVLPYIVKSSVENKPLKFTETIYGFHLCGHFFHKTCINDYKSKYFKCPIDRCIRNNFLPKIDKKFTDSLTPKEAEAIKEFIISGFKVTSIKTIVESIAGELSILEVRHRVRPECLDRSTNYVMFRYLFFSIFHGFHIACQQQELNEFEACQQQELNEFEACDPLSKLIFILLRKDDPVTDYQNDVIEIAASIHDKHLKYQFLRRATLVQHFILDLPLTKTAFIDWDELLEFNELCNRYEIAIDDDEIEIEIDNFDGFKNEIELAPYNFIETPKSFLSFMESPFSVNLADKTKELGICLLTGDIVNMGRQSLNDKIISASRHRTTKMGNTFSIYLQLTGINAGIPCILSQYMNKSIRLKSFYVDSFGDEDQGLKRGSLLKLSPEKLENLVEQLLSSDWTDMIDMQRSQSIFDF
ncbi:hypothetical protein TRFO_16194 [Tritrichomonas foetus]|uniref:E3 ubiquitin-protein ligase n=1 Tax=Tritrichomonas foetus TaxID=1144522 RepID=A0A1J4KVU3_9EUKA|nr:hypothetical protein TRFO_16194 [Tritrichomonas foetus]|eukprot:OHT13637.1 hypothetical protein TRFO_16194 [Tritrichomonas foetus]